eukprot:scaffold97_cov261-Pinguiococcus_pyrenoidosus.AAC.17
MQRLPGCRQWRRLRRAPEARRRAAPSCPRRPRRIPSGPGRDMLDWRCLVSSSVPMEPAREQSDPQCAWHTAASPTRAALSASFAIRASLSRDI